MTLNARILKAVLILPFNAAGTVPAIVLWLAGLSRWREPWATMGIATGAVLIVAAVYGGYRTLTLFARTGEGTPGPWDPPKHLVVEGPYRHVRNPMISSVVFALIGEALVFNSAALSIYAAVFLVGNLVYIRLFEEPALVERFGEEYVEYRRNVPAWIPRLKPWVPGRGQT